MKQELIGFIVGSFAGTVLGLLCIAILHGGRDD